MLIPLMLLGLIAPQLPPAAPTAPNAAKAPATRRLHIQVSLGGSTISRGSSPVTVAVGFGFATRAGRLPALPTAQTDLLVRELELSRETPIDVEFELSTDLLPPDWSWADDRVPIIWGEIRSEGYRSSRRYSWVTKDTERVRYISLRLWSGFNLAGTVAYPDGGVPRTDDWFGIHETSTAAQSLGPPLRSISTGGHFATSLRERLVPGQDRRSTVELRAWHPVLGDGPPLEVRLREQLGQPANHLDLELQLPARGILAGVLATPAGMPVPGALLLAIPVDELGKDLEAWRCAQAQTDARGHFVFDAVKPERPHHIFLLGADPNALPEPLTETPVDPARPSDPREPLSLTTNTPHLVLRITSPDGVPMTPLLAGWKMTWLGPTEGAPLFRGTFQLTSRPARECLPAGIPTLPIPTKPESHEAWWDPMRASQQGKQPRFLDDGRVVLALIPGEDYNLHAMSLGLASASLHVEATEVGLEERTLRLGPEQSPGHLSIENPPSNSSIDIFTPTGLLIASRFDPNSSLCAPIPHRTADFQLPPGDYSILAQSPRPTRTPQRIDLTLHAGEQVTRSEETGKLSALVTFVLRPNATDGPTTLTHESAWRKLLGPTWRQCPLTPATHKVRAAGKLWIETERADGSFHPTNFRLLDLRPTLQPLPLGRYRFTLKLPGRPPLTQTRDIEGTTTITFAI